MRAWTARGIVALIALILAADLCLEYSPARMVAYYLLGRHGCCGFVESLPARRYLERRAAAMSHVRENVHKVVVNGRFTLWDTPQGRFWVQTRDHLGFVPLLAEQELRVYGPVPMGGVVLDCGAKIGDFTRSALADGAAAVVSIEISPDNLECLRRNFKDEIASGRLMVVSDGVWDRDVKMNLFTSSVGPAELILSCLKRA